MRHLRCYANTTNIQLICAQVRLTYKRYALHINKMSMIKNPQPIFNIFFFWRQIHVSCGISCQVTAQIYCGSDHINMNFPSCIFSTYAAEVIIWTIQHRKAKRNDTILIRYTDLLKVGEWSRILSSLSLRWELLWPVQGNKDRTSSTCFILELNIGAIM